MKRWILIVAAALVCAACAQPTRDLPRPRAVSAPTAIEPTSRTTLTDAIVPAPVHHSRPTASERAERSAAAVFRSLHPDLLRCAALARGTRSPLDVRVEVLVAADGAVRDVRAVDVRTLARSPATACIERRVAHATFGPAPEQSGTWRVTVPFAFDVGLADEPAPPRWRR